MNSGIDGLKYFADKNRRWFERVWWFFAVALSFTFCAYLMADLWVKHQVHPVTVMYDDKISAIGSIPFPAVTICPAGRIPVDKLNLSNIYEKYRENWPESLRNATIEE